VREENKATLPSIHTHPPLWVGVWGRRIKDVDIYKYVYGGRNVEKGYTLLFNTPSL